VDRDGGWGAIGAVLGASIGMAAVPIIGTALGALAGWIASSTGNLTFANCDGTLAAAMHAFIGSQRRTSISRRQHLGDDHLGTDPPRGCGSHCNYDVAGRSIRRRNA